MLLCYFILGLCSLQSADQQLILSEAEEWALQDTMETYCPGHPPITCASNVSDYTDFVILTDAYDNISSTTDSGVHSCCLGCSCDTNCHHYGTCCYQGTMGRRETQIATCLYLNGNYQHSHRFVMAGPEGGCVTPGLCSFTTQYAMVPYTNFRPVFSMATGLSYITQECAHCHGVNDSVLWQDVLVFTNKFVPLNVDYAMQHMHEYISFLHPGTEAEVRSGVCKNHPGLCFKSNVLELSEREKNGIDITGIPNVSINRLEYACHFGPSSIYMYQDMFYRNVYCVLYCFALGNSVSIETTCSQGDDERRLWDAASTLLSAEITSEVRKTLITNKLTGTKACKEGDVSSCRPILCPHLQLRDDNGHCSFITTMWRIKQAFIYLDITTRYPIEDGTIFNNVPVNDTIDAFQSGSPWPVRWEIYELGMNTTRVNDETHFGFIMSLRFDGGHVDIVELLDEVQHALSEDWVIRVGSVSLTLQQKFLKHGGFTTYRAPHGPTFIPNWLASLMDIKDFDAIKNISGIRSIEQGMPVIYWDVVLTRDTLNMNQVLVINELWFCTQVQLRSAEFGIHLMARDVPVLYNGRTLYPNEQRVSYSVTGDTVVHICMKVFGGYTTTHTEHTTVRSRDTSDESRLIAIDKTTEKFNVATEETDVATEKTELSTEKTDVATEKTNEATEKTDVATEKTNVATEKTDVATENVPSQLRNSSNNECNADIFMMFCCLIMRAVLLVYTSQ